MSLPDHYVRFFRLYLRFAMVLTVLALLMGVAFQEAVKIDPLSSALPAGPHLEAIFRLTLTHGHAFLIGVLIPLAVSWILYLGLALGYPPVSEKALRWSARLYLPAAGLALSLMIYKGFFFLLAARGIPSPDWMAAERGLFGGSRAWRAITYAVTHSALAGGLCTVLFSFWKTMAQPASDRRPTL